MFSRLTVWVSLAAAIASVSSQGTTAPPAVDAINAVSSREWQALNATVKGRLGQGVPWSKPCFDNYNGQDVQPDMTACKYVQDNYFNSHLNRSQEFAGYSATQWETCMSTGEQCELDWQNPLNQLAFTPPEKCSQGSISSYFIDVRNKDDVIAAFKFSKSKGVPLTIKNTGHDFQGRSSGKNTLNLWMHNIKYISRRKDFIAEGCRLTTTRPQDAVTFGAGQQFQEIYQFAHDNGIIVVGGSDQSVGAAGGWGQGGGHSSLTPIFGMGADRTLQYKVVTPDGVYRTANACQNSDLFFALRGGGGGTFGVVLEATMMASPATSFRVANINWPVNNAALDQVMTVFLEQITKLSNQGWGGYMTPPIGNLILTTNTLNHKEAEAALKPLIDLSKKLGGESGVTDIPAYFDWFRSYVQGTSGVQDAIGLPVAMTSRLVPAKLHETPRGRAQLKDALLQGFNASFFHQLHITTPFGFKGKKNGETSINPLWESSLYQVIFVNGWEWNETLADRKAAYEASTKAAAPIRAITPQGGAYHNEADIHEPDWKFSFWNKNYDRLLAIKKKYDPSQLLDCWQCVGWTGARNSRFKCYI